MAAQYSGVSPSIANDAKSLAGVGIDTSGRIIPPAAATLAWESGGRPDGQHSTPEALDRADSSVPVTRGTGCISSFPLSYHGFH